MCSIFMPTVVKAGLSFFATASDDAHPAPDWTLTLHLRGPGRVDIAGTVVAARHVFQAAPAETAAWLAGQYWWAIRATNNAGDVAEVETGDLTIVADMVAANTFDGRSEAEKSLAAIDAVLGKRATLDQERYRINNRELWRTPIADLMKLRAYFSFRVSRERRKATGANSWGRPVPVRFG